MTIMTRINRSENRQILSNRWALLEGLADHTTEMEALAEEIRQSDEELRPSELAENRWQADYYADLGEDWDRRLDTLEEREAEEAAMPYDSFDDDLYEASIRRFHGMEPSYAF